MTTETFLASTLVLKEHRVRSWYERLTGWLNTRWVYHTLGWAFYCFVMLWLTGGLGGKDFSFHLGNVLVRAPFMALVVYGNWYYLMPNFLEQGRPWTYLLLLSVGCVLVTPLEIMALYLKLSGQPFPQSQVIQNQLGFFVIMFAVGYFSSAVKIIKGWQQQRRRQETLEKERLQTELKFLRSQINPHFLFNTLNSLYALTLKKSDLAPELVLRLSDMMRYMLYESNERLVPLQKEITYLENYLELERMRQGQRVDISMTISGQEISELHYIAPLFFVNFVENAFKHGLSNQLDEAFVHIRIKILGTSIVFEIDNSKPETYETGHHHGGIGVENSRRRLALLYPGRHELVISDTPRKYSVMLSLEL